MAKNIKKKISAGLPNVDKVILGRSGITSTRLGLGFGGWPFRIPYQQFLAVLQTTFDCGIRHLDVAALYCTEELLGKGLKEIDAPDDVVISTKACAYRDDEIGIEYQEYSAATVYRSVERSLKKLQMDYLHNVHIHDVMPENLEQVFAKEGALSALLKLKEQGVIGSIGMATVSIDSLLAAVDCGEFDHIQFFHSYTLLNTQAAEVLIPRAKAANLTVMNNAPQAGFVLASGPVPGACYNYWPASQGVLDAAARLQKYCQKKKVALGDAALAFSLANPDIDVTVIAGRSPERIKQCVAAINVPLTRPDYDEMLQLAGGPYPLRSPHGGNPWHSGPWPKNSA